MIFTDYEIKVVREFLKNVKNADHEKTLEECRRLAYLLSYHYDICIPIVTFLENDGVSLGGGGFYRNENGAIRITTDKFTPEIFLHEYRHHMQYFLKDLEKLIGDELDALEWSRQLLLEAYADDEVI